MSQTEDSRRKALALALNQIERNHGKGAIMRLGNEGGSHPGRGDFHRGPQP